jgi:glycosyltransferase involved in cell wall biosynthesis
LRREFGAGAGDILIGAVGNLRQPKDYPNFLQAAALLAGQSNRYRFVIVGSADEPLNSELRNLASTLGLMDKLIITGFRSDIPAVMNALDVYVLSSSAEGFSLTTVQAMASGVPVVATRCGGPEEIVEDGRTGYLVPPRTPAALAEAVRRVAESDTTRDEFASRGRERAVRDFSIASMIRGYETLYENLTAIRLPQDMAVAEDLR